MNSTIRESLYSSKLDKNEKVNNQEVAVVAGASDDNGEIVNSYKKDIVPLRQFLRYSIHPSDRRSFKRHRITRPFKDIYEIEWEKNQWLQLDRSTNRQIERLQRKGFTKIPIRKDTFLKRYIMYDNPNDIDVLLELSIHPTKVNHTHLANTPPEPITCHQPRHFSVRRVRWWKTSYEIGEAYLPDWVDSDLCCEAVLMDAQSVLAAMTTNSKSPSSSLRQSKLPDTPVSSNKSSFSQLYQNDDSWPYKSLKYSDPPFLSDGPTITVA
ncbi:uncharacterized protein BX663DRAFT_435573 [Cokeromyces recurvatus]|uniref:uncharacterized protein n=1 Tax=Cokeromyces recurvatus TaxID=90255 RepID=UPI00221F8B61|nr:uncharacterized protein BX663DRAFT_435573 [Cokeromyces recurvatus]KAI7902492.1 hypothetical protein BX663DRAFT_435573 [Cokeromyces recurvatus]